MQPAIVETPSWSVLRPCQAIAPARSPRVRGQVDDDGDVLVAAAGMAPHVFIDPDHAHPITAGRIGDQHPAAFGQHCIVGGVPRHWQRLCDAGHAQVLAHNGLQHPPQSASRQSGPRFGDRAAVLASHMGAASAPVATDREQQRGGPPPQRFMSELSGHGIARPTLLTAATTPPVLVEDSAG